MEDFVRGADKLDIASIPTGRTDQAAFQFIDTAGFTAAGQVRETVQDGRAVLQGNTNADKLPEFDIELGRQYNLTANDFLL